MAQMTVEELQEAFYNFDEKKSFTLPLEELRRIMVEEGEPINDVLNFSLFSFLFFFSALRFSPPSC
jgi:Ca2+-binding EF-hand superfamily protein